MTAGETGAWPCIDEVSVVVPVYMSAATVGRLVAELAGVLERCTKRFELILVDDGSADRSWLEVVGAAQGNGCVRGVRLMRNFGQHNALLAGIRAARYAVTVTLDDDLQNPPAEIPTLIAALGDRYDVVYGVPIRERHNIWRALASRATKVALREALGGGRAVTDVSAFRAFRTPLRNAFASFQSPSVSIDVLLTWGTTAFTAIPVEQHPRASGESTYTFRKLVIHASNMVTGFSTRPLQLASLIGFVFTLLGAGALGYVGINYVLRGGGVPGFTFLAALIAIFSGAQLFALGVLGEYLARMHFRLMERPAYVVQQTTWQEDGGPPVVESSEVMSRPRGPG